MRRTRSLLKSALRGRRTRRIVKVVGEEEEEVELGESEKKSREGRSNQSIIDRSQQQQQQQTCRGKIWLKTCKPSRCRTARSSGCWALARFAICKGTYGVNPRDSPELPRMKRKSWWNSSRILSRTARTGYTLEARRYNMFPIYFFFFASSSSSGGRQSFFIFKLFSQKYSQKPPHWCFVLQNSTSI